MGYKTLAVVNPNSANGSTRKMWPEISAEIEKYLPNFKYVFTTHSGHATELARQGIKDGYEMIMAVGGDGTNNEVVNGFFEDGKAINQEAVFTHITQGTGGDLRKTLGTPRDFRLSCPLLSGSATRVIDLGKMTLIGHDDKEQVRYFINIASAGIGGEVDARVNATTKALGGLVSFAWGSLSAFATYRKKKMTLTVDGEVIYDDRALNIVVANGQFFGGGMQVAPFAKMDDGVFDIIIMGDLSFVETLTTMPRIYNGNHVKHPKVEYLNGQEVKLESEGTALVDMDGEQPGKLPATFSIMPNALQVKVMDEG